MAGAEDDVEIAPADNSETASNTSKDKKQKAKKKDASMKDVNGDSKSDASDEDLDVVDEAPSNEEMRELDEAEQDDASVEENLDVVDEEPTAQDLVELEMAPKDSVYNDIILKGVSGTLTLQQEVMIFQSGSTEKKATKRLQYEQISKHQGNPPKSKKVLLKLVMKDNSNIMLELKDRDSMQQLRSELNLRMDTFAALPKAKEEPSKEKDSKLNESAKSSDSNQNSSQKNDNNIQAKTEINKPVDAPNKKGEKIPNIETPEVKESVSGKAADDDDDETGKQPTKETSEADESDNKAEESDFTPFVFKNVQFQGETGSLSYMQQEVIFQKYGDDSSHTSIVYDLISKHQSSPPKIPKAMLKIVLTEGKPLTFQFSDRKELKQAHNNLTAAIKQFEESKISISASAVESTGEPTPNDLAETAPKSVGAPKVADVTDQSTAATDSPTKKDKEIPVEDLTGSTLVEPNTDATMLESGIDGEDKESETATDMDISNDSDKREDHLTPAATEDVTESTLIESDADNNTENILDREEEKQKGYDSLSPDSTLDVEEENDKTGSSLSEVTADVAGGDNAESPPSTESIVNPKVHEGISETSLPDSQEEEKTSSSNNTPEKTIDNNKEETEAAMAPKDSDYKDIILKGVSGTLALQQELMIFQSGSTEKKATKRLQYEQISKHQGNPPKSKKILLKLVMKDNSNIMLELKDRDIMQQLRSELSLRMDTFAALPKAKEEPSKEKDSKPNKSAKSSDSNQNSSQKNDNNIQAKTEINKPVDAPKKKGEKISNVETLESSIQPGKSEAEKEVLISENTEEVSAGKASIDIGAPDGPSALKDEMAEIMEIPKNGDVKEEGGEEAHTGDLDTRTKRVSDEHTPVGVDYPETKESTEKNVTQGSDGMSTEEELPVVEQDANTGDEPDLDVENENEPEAEIEEDEFESEDEDKEWDESGVPEGEEEIASSEDVESQSIEVHHHLVEEDLGVIEVMGLEDPHPEETQASSLLGSKDLDDEEEEDEDVIVNTPQQRSKRASLLERNEALEIERKKRIEDSVSESDSGWEDGWEDDENDDNWEETEMAFFDDDEDGVISNQFEEEESISMLLGGGDSVSNESQEDSETTLSLPGEDDSLSSSNSRSRSDSDSSTASLADDSDHSSEGSGSASGSASRSSSSKEDSESESSYEGEAEESSESSSEEEYYDPASAWLTYTETQDEDGLPEVAPKALKIRKKEFKRRESDSDSEEEYSSEEESEYESSSEGTDTGDMSAEGFRSVEDFDEENLHSIQKDRNDFYDWSNQATLVNGAIRDKSTFFNWKKYSKDHQSKPEEAEVPPPPPPPSTPPPLSTPLPEDKESAPPAPPPTVSDTDDDSVVEKWTIRAFDDPEKRYFNWKGFAKDKRPLPPAFDWKKHAKERRKLTKKQKTDNVKEQGPPPSPNTPNNSINNGIDLLKKLMSTRDDKARAVMLSQHIAPVTQDQTHPHVSPDELLRAVAKFVEMIRAVRKTDECPEIVAARQVAIVARLAIIKLYGEGSEVLRTFELGLVPAFAPQVAQEVEAAS